MFVRRWQVGLVATTFTAGLLASCGSSGGSAQPPSSAVQSTCQAVSAVLSSGPDPGADPVGYALAQILPLRKIKKTSDASLQHTIDQLSKAYQEFYDHNGNGEAAKRAVAQATDRINALCPGAGAAS